MKSDRQRKEDAVYFATHHDFKGRFGGVRSIMVLRNGGSTIVPLSELTDEEISSRLPKNA